jgi:hypothetical protein
MEDIADVRRQVLVYEDTDDAWRVNRVVLDYEARLQALGALKIKEYRVLISRLDAALRDLRRGKRPKDDAFASTVFVDEEDARPFALTEEGVLRKMERLGSRIQELQELLKIRHV